MTQSNADLVRAAATGDRVAFEMLVSKNAAMVTGVAYSRCGDFGLSEDIAQEAFLEAWKNLATIHEPEKFPGWICTIARRRAIDAVRSAKSTRSKCTLGEMALKIPDHTQLTPEAIMSKQQESELVWAMLARLPEAYREPLVSFYRCEESTRDVAIALGESEATIRQRLKRGRDMLRTEMTASIRNTLGATVPKAAFAAMVMASLPSATYAAGAATSTATVVKTNSAAGAGVTSAIGGAILGSLIGIAGGVLGTWMSWKNCEYESQQKFILHQTLRYVIGLSVFGILLAILLTVRQQGMIADDTVYSWLLVTLIVVSQVLNFAWIWHGIRGYKQIADKAKLRGEPMRQVAQQQMDAIRQLTQVTNSDGSITYEAFLWNAGLWFGSCIGSTAWMLPISAIAFWYGSLSLGIISCLTFFITVSSALVAWRFRERIDAYEAIQLLIGLVFVLTTIVLAGLQFLGNTETQKLAQWTPWGWCILLMFPIVSLQIWWTRRSFKRKMSSSG
jgi:RNA polymerase sigma factor (sigma-70 family)